MNKFYRFAAAAAAIAVAAASTSCSSPKAIQFGTGTNTALTIDGYEVPAGVFIYNELYAYNNAAYNVYSQKGEYPSVEDVMDTKIESLDAADWIQDKAVDFCKDFVVTEKEFEKIGAQLSEEDLQSVEEQVSAQLGNALFAENGIGEKSIRAIAENSYKQQAVFKHYYGIDAEKGCSEDELKQYFIDRTARIKYFAVSFVDSEGNPLDDDEKHELTKLVDGYVKEINSAKTNEKKLEKIDECEKKYNEYTAKKAEEKAAKEAEEAAKEAEEKGETTQTTTTTTTTTSETETTTTSAFQNEVTVTRITTTAAKEEEGEETTTTTEMSDEAKATKKAQEDYNDYLFTKLGEYKAEKYQYDENNVYVIIKGNIEERMTDDDMWSDENKESLLTERYYNDFSDDMKKLADAVGIEKNMSAFRRFFPAKLDLTNM